MGLESHTVWYSHRLRQCCILRDCLSVTYVKKCLVITAEMFNFWSWRELSTCLVLQVLQTSATQSVGSGSCTVYWSAQEKHEMESVQRLGHCCDSQAWDLWACIFCAFKIFFTFLVSSFYSFAKISVCNGLEEDEFFTTDSLRSTVVKDFHRPVLANSIFL